MFGCYTAYPGIDADIMCVCIKDKAEPYGYIVYERTERYNLFDEDEEYSSSVLLIPHLDREADFPATTNELLFLKESGISCVLLPSSFQ